MDTFFIPDPEIKRKQKDSLNHIGRIFEKIEGISFNPKEGPIIPIYRDQGLNGKLTHFLRGDKIQKEMMENFSRLSTTSIVQRLYRRHTYFERKIGSAVYNKEMAYLLSKSNEDSPQRKLKTPHFNQETKDLIYFSFQEGQNSKLEWLPQMRYAYDGKNTFIWDYCVSLPSEERFNDRKITDKLRYRTKKLEGLGLDGKLHVTKFKGRKRVEVIGNLKVEDRVIYDLINKRDLNKGVEKIPAISDLSRGIGPLDFWFYEIIKKG
ncbi:hypothetical protein ISS08_02155 [Candidatus Pacearchaeota archaeon]|nr:hypothetical protein [Candidatus Pacearchaeota archaeon]